ncbi:hypothetical protein ACHAXR_000654, partial [Thalassiosira sp. AJA248-18]
PKPEITKAVARGDLAAVQKIVDAAADKIKTINHARKWTEHNLAYYSSEDNPSSVTEWFDVTPITTAAMRGHDEIVQYLLQQGADPTLKGCPKDDIELPNDDGSPLIDLPELHMNAFDAANKLSRKIRCCRRTVDLLLVVKPYWKKCVYSGSAAIRHKRTMFSNLPLNMGWIVDALGEVPPLKGYPIKAKNFDEGMIDSNYWKKRKREESNNQNYTTNNSSRDGLPKSENTVELFVGQGSGRQRRCFSCGELKPEQSYNKNEKKKGVEARCLSCFASNPVALDIATIICPVCKKPKLDDNGAVCQPCMSRMANESKKPPATKTEPTTFHN